MRIKLDRANTAKVQIIDDLPTVNTRGNIAVNEDDNVLYYKSNSTWYATTGAVGGVFELGTGAYSAQRIGIGLDLQGDYSFAAGPSISITSAGGYSAAFGASHTISGTYNLVSGLSNTVTSSNYNLVCGRDNTTASSTNYNIIGGYGNSAQGTYNIYTGISNSASNSSVYYNAISGRNNTISSSSSSIIAGEYNTVSQGYGLTYGTYNENAENYASVYGKKAKAIWAGARHFSGDEISSSAGAGTSQGMDICLHAQTVGAVTEDMILELGDSNSPLYCPDNTTQYLKVVVLGVSDSTDTGAEVSETDLLITRVDPTDIGISTTGVSSIMTSGSNIGSVDCSVSTSLKLVEIRVTGTAGVTTNWVAYVYALQTKGAYTIAVG